MIQQAEIDAIVEAFVENLTGVVRRAALEAVRSALLVDAAPPFEPTRAKAPTPKPAPVAKRPPTPARAPDKKPSPAKPAKPAKPARPPSTKAAPPAPAPSPVRKRLEERRGRVFVVPATPAPALPADEPEKKPTPKPAPKPAPAKPAPSAQPAAGTSEAGSSPARKWVVVRRPAKASGEPKGTVDDGGAVAADAPTGGEGA